MHFPNVKRNIIGLVPRHRRITNGHWECKVLRWRSALGRLTIADPPYFKTQYYDDADVDPYTFKLHQKIDIHLKSIYFILSRDFLRRRVGHSFIFVSKRKL